MKLSAVLFDFAYTLFYPPDPIPLLRDAGIPHDEATAMWRQIWRDAHQPDGLTAGRDLSAHDHRQRWLEHLAPADGISAGLASRLYEAFCHPSRWQPYPDVPGLLAWIWSQRLPIGLVSNVTSDLRPIMARHGLDRYIGAYVLSYEIGAEKPAAKVFDIACAKLGVTPGECLMVGDCAWADGGASLAGLAALILPPLPDAHGDRLWILSRLLGRNHALEGG